MKLVALGCVLVAGCILPISTGAPMPATTVGQGRIGGALSAEAPVLDLISDNRGENMTGSPSAVTQGAAPAAAMTFTLSYGLGDDTDVELAAEGALYWFVLPMPTGGSIGLRHHIDASDSIDLAIAARFGGVASNAEVSTSSGTQESSASATYGAIQAVLQSKRGLARPLFALNVMPARIKRDPSDEGPFSFRGVASSATLGLMLVTRSVVIGPYVAATNFYSDRYDNSGFFFSGGFILAIRPDRSRQEPPAPPPPAAPYAPAPPPPTPTTTPM